MRLLTKKSSRPNEIWVCCPFCVEKGKSPDTEYKLGVNVKTGLAHCFRCGWKSFGENTFRKLKLAKRGPAVDFEEEKREKETGLPEGYVRLDPKHDKEEDLRIPWLYLRKRGVNLNQVRRKRVGTCISGRYEGRIIFPVWDEHWELTGFVGRLYTRGEPKYKNSVGIGRVWYGSHMLPKTHDSHQIILTEGIMDALAVERATNEIALASLGVEVTDDQETQLDRFKNIVVFLDRDMGGVWRGLDLAARLQEHGRSLLIALPPEPYKDAGECPEEEIRKSISMALPYSKDLATRMRSRILRRA